MSPGPPNRALKPTVPFVTGLAGAAVVDDVSPIRAEPVYHGRLVKQVPRRTAGGPTAPGGRAGGLAWSLDGPSSRCSVREAGRPDERSSWSAFVVLMSQLG